MRFFRTLGPSLRALLAHRTRSALAAAGVAVGIAAVYLTTAVAQGAEAEVLGSIGTMGTRLLVVRPAQVAPTTARKEIRGFVSSLKFEDALAIQTLPRLVAVAPSVEGPVKVKTHRGVIATQLLGTTKPFFQARSFELAAGRLFDDDEDRATSRVVVLGGRASRTLFPDENPVGQEVLIRGVAFEVIGTLKPRGASADGADADSQVFVPVRTALRRVFNSRSLTRVFVSVRDSNDLDPAEQEVRTLLRERHHLDRRDRPDDFAIQNQRRFLAAQQKTAQSLRYVTIGIAAVSLLVGGTGILALMLLSVKERTPEIGLRMAVGARPWDILLQFLAEAMALALTGGMVGTTLGLTGAWMVAKATQWPVRLSLDAGLVSLAMAMAVGLFFGVLPARQAARMTPVRALGLE